ncbi:MAG: hypothetical protein AAGB04_05945 [Pseudomonadota bacterium]
MLKLVKSAGQEADQFADQVVIEHSDRSEAAYLHVQRGKTWFGYRIACHLPVYPCSADYQQIIVPRDADADVFANSVEFLRLAVRSHGQIVASPAEVSGFIKRVEVERDKNLTSTTQAAVKINKRRNGRRPYHRPRGSRRIQSKKSTAGLSHLEKCQIRHRLNLIARWTYEFENGRQHPDVDQIDTHLNDEPTTRTLTIHEVCTKPKRDSNFRTLD